MRLRHASALPWDVDVDVMVVPVSSGPGQDGHLAEIDRRISGALGDMRRIGALTGKAWEGRLVPAGEMAARLVLLLGVGEGIADETSAWRMGAVAVRRLAGCQVERLGLYLPAWLRGPDLAPGMLAELVTRGLVEGAAEPSTIYREAPEKLPPSLSECVLVTDEPASAELSARAERGLTIGEGGNRTRRLAQRAANDVSPEVLADEATDIARDLGMQLTVIGPDEAAALGMGMFVSVGRGSSNPPRFIALRTAPHRARDARGRLVALVGKGVTFDSGGISIKPAERMGDMKMDKTGACTVIEATATIARLAPEVPVLAVAPAVENMPGPNATRPGDVIRALNGKTVEVTNTDAEGRLILGDALTWAEQQGATHLVDVATLTGAVARALGRFMSGGFGTPQEWWDEMAASARRQGEPLWQLPLNDDYRADMESPYADMVNSAMAEASLLHSALFLKEFVTRPWIHLDIAGSAYLQREAPWAARGATGVMHASLVELGLGGAG